MKTAHTVFKIKTSRLISFFRVAVGFLMMAGFAQGYVLQGEHILDLYAEKAGKAGDLLVLQKLSLNEVPDARAPAEFRQNIKYKYPASFRSEIVSDDREWIYVHSKSGSVTLVNGRIISSADTVFDRYAELLLYRSRDNLVRLLMDFKVDVDISSLGRFNGRVAYVVGAKYPDMSAPQIWFDRDSFRPVRWLQPVSTLAGASQTTEIQFSGWHQTAGGWYPGEIEFRINDATVRRIIVDEVRPGAGFSDEQFDVDHIRSAYPLDMTADEAPEHSTDGFGELKTIIDNFKKIYE